jgi:hypothetical protein
MPAIQYQSRSHRPLLRNAQLALTEVVSEKPLSTDSAINRFARSTRQRNVMSGIDLAALDFSPAHRQLQRVKNAGVKREPLLAASILPLMQSGRGHLSTRAFPNGAQLETMTMYRGSIPVSECARIGNGGVSNRWNPFPLREAAAQQSRSSRRQAKIAILTVLALHEMLRVPPWPA